MILTDRDILRSIKDGSIVIEPFTQDCLGTNSYDVHLGPLMLTYKERFDGGDTHEPRPLDVLEARDCDEHMIPENGFVLKPGELYLASTIEYTESHEHVPMLNGKSSLGRLGLTIHVTAGTGDIGFCNHWTLEMTVVRPLRIYTGMPIGQLLWFQPRSIPLKPYDKKPGAKYQGRNPRPGPSQFYKNSRKTWLL